MRLKLAVKKQWTEALPVRVLASRRVDDAIERVRLDRPVLLQIRSIEERVADDVASTEGRLSAELFKHQLLHRVVEHAPPDANAGFARLSRTPRQTHTRRERLVISASETRRHSW